MKDKLLDAFTDEIKTAKYFSIIIIDSTLDISHCDQLTFVIRYVYKGQIAKRFMGFLKIEKHTAEYLQEIVLYNLKQLGLDIENCRGQNYDNATNMSGKYNSLQTSIRTRISHNCLSLCPVQIILLICFLILSMSFVPKIDYFNLVHIYIYIYIYIHFFYVDT